MEKLAKSKINIIRRRFLAGKVHGKKLALELEVQCDTVYKYLREFREIERLYPKKITDLTFMLPRKRQVWSKSGRHEEMIKALPALVENASSLYLNSVSVWNDYKNIYPDGYCHDIFRIYYSQWIKQNNIYTYYHRRVKSISSLDEDTLQHWRLSDDMELWRKAVLILDSFRGRALVDIAVQIEISQETLLKWIELYQNKGISALIKKAWTQNARVADEIKQKRSNLVILLQQTPKLYDINRTSWRLTDLSRVYEKVYKQPLSNHAIGDHLKKLGYKFQKSRERLTSPDKKFHEKMARIKSILANLKPTEKFFSIDEYGPSAVKMKVGWSITKEDEKKTVPQLQKSKGWYIMTAALELSTNQVTHFYSYKKDTAEMIKLIDVLIQQYKDDDRLYLSWDCASWHASKKLTAHLQMINSKEYQRIHETPSVELAPLPSSAQYLNIIESVFSGMAKSIIHNSDYECLDECKAAINRYFKERNAYFAAHPQKAGKKIWGMEIVKPVFDEMNNCKSRLRVGK